MWNPLLLPPWPGSLSWEQSESCLGCHSCGCQTGRTIKRPQTNSAPWKHLALPFLPHLSLSFPSTPPPPAPVLALSGVKCSGLCLFTPMEDLTRPSPALIWSPELLSVHDGGGKTESGNIFSLFGNVEVPGQSPNAPSNTNLSLPVGRELG